MDAAKSSDNDVRQRIETYFSFLRNMIDTKLLVVMSHKKLYYWANEVLPTWLSTVTNIYEREIYRSLLQRQQRIYSEFLDSLGLRRRANLGKLKNPCNENTADVNSADDDGSDNECSEEIAVNDKLTRIRVKNETRRKVQHVLKPLTDAVTRARQTVILLQNSSLMPYYRRVDEYVEFVLYVIRRVITNDTVKEPLFTRSPLNAIVTRDIDNNDDDDAGKSLYNNLQKINLNWDTGPTVPEGFDCENIIPLSKSPSSVEEIARRNHVLFAGLVLLEPLFTDLMALSSSSSTSTDSTHALIERDFGYPKLSSDWKRWMLDQRASASKRNKVAQNAESDRHRRSYMNLSVMARRGIGFTASGSPSKRTVDAVESVYRYINCVWYYFTEIDTRSLPVLGCSTATNVQNSAAAIDFNRETEKLFNFFPPFRVQLKQQQQQQQQQRELLLRQLYSESTLAQGDPSTQQRENNRQSDNQRDNDNFRLTEEDVNPQQRSTSSNVPKSTATAFQRKIFTMRKTLEVTLLALGILRSHSVIREIFIAKINELSEFVPWRCPGIILFRLIYPLVPVVIVGICPALLDIVRIEDTAISHEQKSRIILTTVTLFCYCSAKLTGLASFKYSREPTQTTPTNGKNSKTTNSKNNHKSHESQRIATILRDLKQTLLSASSEALLDHFDILKSTRCKEWERIFWINTGGGNGKKDSESAVRRAHFVYLNT